MTIQHHLPDKVHQADPWTFYCAACLEKMRIKTPGIEPGWDENAHLQMHLRVRLRV
jgi:hypothetical protein